MGCKKRLGVVKECYILLQAYIFSVHFYLVKTNTMQTCDGSHCVRRVKSLKLEQ